MENQVPVFDYTYVSPPSPQDAQAEKNKKSTFGKTIM